MVYPLAPSQPPPNATKRCRIWGRREIHPPKFHALGISGDARMGRGAGLKLQLQNPLELPKIFLVGGPDIDARLDLMHGLQDQFEFTAVGSNENLSAVFEKNGFPYHAYAPFQQISPLNDFVTILKLTQLFQKEKPALVHTFGTKPCALARIAAKLAKVPVIVGTISGLGILYSKTGIKYASIRFFYEILQKIASHLSDLTIFQNEDDRERFIARGIVPPEKTAIILGSGILTEKFNSSRFSVTERKQIRKELQIPAGHFLVTLIARLIRTKGVIEFCEAANALKEEGEFSFLLIGSADEDNLDRLSAAEMDYVRNSVVWLKERNDVDLILAASDLFVFPSSYGEGIPRVLLEAASMGLPLVATDIPGCRVVIEDGKNGILISPKDAVHLAEAIRNLAANKVMREDFGKISRAKMVNTFDLKYIIRKTEEIYTDLLSHAEE